MSSDYTQDLRNAYNMLESNIKTNEQKIQSQHKIYTELYRVFLKHANKIATLANSINQDILDSVNQEELTVQHYQVLSNCLLRLADSSRRVSLRLKSEILDPLKTFSQNYDNVYEDVRKQFDSKIYQLTLQEQETQKQKEQYNYACQKFDKHRETQKKVMEKIESGSKSELQRFNLNTKKLTENITSHEKFYISSVQKINNELEISKKEFGVINQSISYNQDTRRSFFRKTIINTIKTFEEFTAAYDPDVVKKLQDSSKVEGIKYQDNHQKKIRMMLDRTIKSDHQQEFVSYEDLMKSKRKKINEEDNSHLQQYFSKLKEKDKKTIKLLVDQWFGNNSSNSVRKGSQSRIDQNSLNKSRSSQSLKSIISQVNIKGELDSEKTIREFDLCKQKIISVLTHSLYFLQLLYGKILEMTSFYFKINQDHFLFLLNAFSIITKNMDTNSDVGIEFTYKMMITSQRIMLKKNVSNKNSNQPIELLCQKYCKCVNKFKDIKFLGKLLSYIEKRKTNRKKNNENKGALNIAKGFLAAFSRGKTPSLNQDEQYNCLQEMIMIISNFSIPNEIILPFIKETLGNSHQGSYQYLKNVILSKKDVEERRSLFYRKEIKQKKEELMKKALETKKIGEYVLKIVAEHGYFGMEELQFRVICKEFKNIHLEILPRLKLPTQNKWIRLIPVDKKLDYIQMKQEVAQNSVPSSIEEIITLDVNRSLHLHGQTLNPTILHSLLRTYAYYNTQISYCQGMNYLAGYIYLKTKNEEYTYRIFEYLMQQRFHQIFINEFEVLKIKMYQFDRLLAIFHPEISEHFKRQSITPECYIVSWIITMFASSYQYTLESYLIDILWERFIIWGWPEFYRFVLWIFSQFKEDLVELTYDKALHFLGELGRSELFLSDTQKYKENFEQKMGDPIDGIERYPVSQQLLNKFTNEYNLDQ